MRLTTAALSMGALVLGSGVGMSPASAYTTITVETPDCARCRVSIQSIENHDYGFFQLKHGRAKIHLDEGITSFALGIDSKEGFSGIASQTVIAFQYRYFPVGSPVSAAQSREGRSARICHAPLDGETIRFRVKKIPIPKSYFKRKGVIPPQPGQKFTLRAWASPTASTVDTYSPTNQGITGIQNDVCGPVDIRPRLLQ